MPILGYWDIQGRAQPIRYLLSHLGVAYEDRYFQQSATNEQHWKDVKAYTGLDFPNLPFFVDTDGTKLTESLAILEYVAAKWCPQYLGNDAETRAKVLMLLGVLADQSKAAVFATFNPQTTQEELNEKTGDYAYSLTQILKDSPYFLGEEITIVDFYVFP